MMGITGSLFKVIESMYDRPTVCARTDTGLSDEVEVKKGVLQGNSLSPTLFNIFINDIVNHLQGNESPTIDQDKLMPVPCLMYADDIVILSTSKTGLQNKLNNLHQYCEDWGLKINRDKTKVIVFSKQDPKVPLYFKIGEAIITSTDSYKYLGVMFHKRGDFTLAQEHLSRQATKAIYSLNKAIKTKHISVLTMVKLFDNLVAPILTYSSEVWFPYCKDLASKNPQNLIGDFLAQSVSSSFPHENVHLKFCKRLLGVNNKSMNLPVLAELGKFPLSLKIMVQSISYWTHIVNLSDKSLLKQTYLELIRGDDISNNEWISTVRGFLLSAGYKHIWQNQATFSAGRLKHSLTLYIENAFKSFWKRITSHNTSRLLFYKTMPSDFGLQSYLLLPKEDREAMTKIRISAHDLEIERGRYAGLPRVERLCKICRTIEDEFHFLNECTLYVQLRDSLKRSIDEPLAKQSISSLFSTSDQRIIRKLATYARECLNLRRQTVKPT
jgi:hypothetical protein